MKFIHFADAHLDSPFYGLSFLPNKAFQQIKTASEISLKRICDLALRQKVDLVLIAGDSFDSAHPSPHSQLFFKEQIDRLCAAKIQVVMIFGNHDHMKAQDLFLASPYFKLLGAGEKVERASFETQSGFKYDVVGFSYLQNHISQDLIASFPPRQQNYTFGLAHAQLKQESHNVYAPFKLNEVKNLNYDYFALGHIHLRQVLSQNPWIVYPGNIQGRDIKEVGAKGCYLGEIDEQTRQTKISFQPTAPLLWQQKELLLSAAIAKNELSQQILSCLEAEGDHFYSLRIKGAEFLTKEEVDLVQDADYWQLLGQKLNGNSQLVDVRFAENQKLPLAPTDAATFSQAQRAVFAPASLRQLAHSWLRKDAYAEQLLADSDFLAELKELTQVKLGQKIAEQQNETHED